MAKKQRILESLRAVESELRKAAKTGSKKNAVNIRENLTAIRDVCRVGLPENSYAKYGEIYDGLILAVEQMTKVKELRLNEEAFSLSMDLLQYLIRITEEETGFKKDIVFLPYKASMWDSLESVWKAAAEDEEHCNAYVIPIPYADLNPDGSIARWHCERADYPVYVPTLDWRSVDLKELHPDVIFIHNPYDDENRVTSVETRYYSKNLRECTDKLVYIPYAVEEEVQPGNQAVEDAISHRVLEPGIMNADVVIAQSEDMRQAWINILMRRTNVNNRAYWEKRIIGLGSPKIDKVLTSKKEDFVMPRKWKQLVKGKKVILYITSLSPMLHNSDHVCDKLRYVFDVFRNRDDVVLWWRPHPLMKATFHSMRPEIEKEYLKIERQYIEEGWGIYDDTSDLHRAICWSDAYYGDYSSVMVLYEAAGKKVLKQSYQDPIWLCATNALIDGENLYFVPYNLNGAFVFNTTTGEMKLCSIFDDGWRYRKLSAGWHIGNFSNNGKLYGMVQCGKSYYIYDFSKKSAKSIDISNKFASDELVQFYKTHQLGDDVWLSPHHGKAIGRYNIKTREIVFYPEIFSLVQNRWNGAYPIWGDSVQALGSLWILYAQGNDILEFNTASCEVYPHNVKDVDGKILTIEFDGENFWLYTTSGMLIEWVPKIGVKQKITNPLGLVNEFGNIKYINGKIWIVANYQDVYGVVDCHTGEIQIFKNMLNSVSGRLGVAVLQASDDFLYVMPSNGNVLIRINTKNNNVESWKVELTDDIKEIYQQKFIETFSSGDYEWNNESITYILDSLCKHNIAAERQLVGTKIYDLV
ncbi:MAG: CDP-glycerol glycerophosphotransferase family protein [Selenomonadaceae bacterium]|nr:CDP-glycerol glycerophosphotransferase family protein [Selenomonadaceae bacterium]